MQKPFKVTFYRLSSWQKVITHQGGHRRHNTGAKGYFHTGGLQRRWNFQVIQPAQGWTWVYNLSVCTQVWCTKRCPMFWDGINDLLSIEGNGGFWRMSKNSDAAVTVGSPRTRTRHFTHTTRQQVVNPSESNAHSFNSAALRSSQAMFDGEKMERAVSKQKGRRRETLGAGFNIHHLYLVVTQTLASTLRAGLTQATTPGNWSSQRSELKPAFPGLLLAQLSALPSTCLGPQGVVSCWIIRLDWQTRNRQLHANEQRSEAPAKHQFTSAGEEPTPT